MYDVRQCDSTLLNVGFIPKPNINNIKYEIRLDSSSFDATSFSTIMPTLQSPFFIVVYRIVIRSSKDHAPELLRASEVLMEKPGSGKEKYMEKIRTIRSI